MGNESSQPLKYGERLDNDINIKWTKVDTENPFPPRESHCSTALNSKLYVYGGVIQSGDEEPVESNDLLVFDSGRSQLFSRVSSSVSFLSFMSSQV